MPKSSTDHLNQNNSEENCQHPFHVSDRINLMVNEIDEEKVGQLYNAYTEMDIADWLLWFETNLESFLDYDSQSNSEHKKKLKNANIEILKCHHACIFLELWRARLNENYLPLPPNGSPIDSKESQREVLAMALASYYDFKVNDLWPFAIPEDKEVFPFKE